MNETHDQRLQSWIESANGNGCGFPLQNLPYGIFRRRADTRPLRGGVAIGDQILDLGAALRAGAFSGPAAEAAAMAAGSSLNRFMAAGTAAWSTLRLALSRALRRGSAQQALLQPCLLPQSQAEYDLPALIGDYTDFYTSIHHATAVGHLFRPDNPLLPNYKWMPIGYHGRASSIAVSGQQFPRPLGQSMAPGAQQPAVEPSRRLDYELELGIFIGPGNAPGSRIAINTAQQQVFGLCLLNDWSARDLQAWEYQPLGPFLGKNFATTISPWIVTLEALEPYCVPAPGRDVQDPAPLPYLDETAAGRAGAFDIQLEVWIQTESMRRSGLAPHRLSQTNFRQAYWTIAQMIAHHTINGCNLRPGDLLGTGTQSGLRPEEAGSLLELTHGGREPLQLPHGETRTFLEDGDEIIMRAHCERPGASRIGFGQVAGRILPALA